MELVVYNPTEEQLLESYEISFNHEELKAELATRLKKYQGLVYSEESISAAKTDRAKLNKFKDAIETKRKEIKASCLKPYEDFEVKIKEIVAMVDKPITEIDKQVKAFEQTKKDEKLNGIKEFYADRVGNLAGIVKLEDIYNVKWLNATYKAKDIEKEITDFFLKVESDLAVITNLQSEYEKQIKDKYLHTFDLTVALQEKTRLEEQAAKIAEYDRLQKEKRVKSTPAAKETGARQTKPAESSSSPVDVPALFVVDFRVRGTREQIKKLQQFLKDNDISYGKVE